MNKKTCCVTGHRTLEESKIVDVKKAMESHILKAMEQGYTHFISGFAQGADLYFAQIVIKLKENYNITLEAAIPYTGRMKTQDPVFVELIKHCDRVVIHSDVYTPDCFMKRNRYMVESSDLVIAVCDERSKGGTKATMSYGRKLGKEVQVIDMIELGQEQLSFSNWN